MHSWCSWICLPIVTQIEQQNKDVWFVLLHMSCLFYRHSCQQNTYVALADKPFMPYTIQEASTRYHQAHLLVHISSAFLKCAQVRARVTFAADASMTLARHPHRALLYAQRDSAPNIITILCCYIHTYVWCYRKMSEMHHKRSDYTDLYRSLNALIHYDDLINGKWCLTYAKWTIISIMDERICISYNLNSIEACIIHADCRQIGRMRGARARW